MPLIQIYKSTSIPEKVKQRLWQRSMADYEKIKTDVKPLMDSVRQRGDTVILEKYLQRNIPIQSLRVTQKEFSRAEKLVSTKFKQAFAIAKSNIQSVCSDQFKSLQNQPTTILSGIEIWRRWYPLSTIGIYVPGGRANYPSSLMMAAIPAITAGVKNLIVCVPPQDDGSIPNEVLAVAKWLQITQVYKVGGPQAIGAMTYGTESVSKVDKIVGPGNQYVNAAKLLAFPTVAIDLPAGPSENLIIADDSADPKFVAADLITDVEHGPDSTGILITTSPTLATDVQYEIGKLTNLVATKETIKTSLQFYGAIIVCKSMAEMITLANDYAPEHIQIMTKKADQVASKIRNAGSVFIGDYSSKAGGDYASGANHVLPTGKMATWAGPLSVESFGKWVEYQQVSQTGFTTLAQSIITFAEVEGLPAHKLSASIRLEQRK